MSSHEKSLFVDRDRELRGFRRMLKPETPQAVMLIEAGEFMGKTWLIARMSRHCKEEAGKVPVVEIDFKNPREKHKIRDVLSLVRLMRDKLGHDSVFNHLNDVINGFTEPQDGAGVSTLHALAEGIQNAYNLSELRSLGHFLDVNFENLPGDTLYEKAYGLAAYFQRRDSLSNLIDRLEEERPRVGWQRLLEMMEAKSPRIRADGALEDGSLITDNGLPLRFDDERVRDLAEERISEAFFICLRKLGAELQPIVFLFDGCEEAPDEAREWIRYQLLDRLRTRKLDQLVIIFAGRKIPDVSDLGIDDLKVETGLAGFDEKYVQEFFEGREVPVDLAEIPLLRKVSGGKPGKLALIADELRTVGDKDDPFFDD
jgi:hypothetical protein